MTIVLVAAAALAEPFRATATLTAGLADGVPGLHGAVDYGVVPHLALAGEAGVRIDGGHSVGGGLLVLPYDGRSARFGLAFIPELSDPIDDLEIRGRMGLRASWLAAWGIGVAGRFDALVSPSAPPALDFGLGLSVRM